MIADIITELARTISCGSEYKTFVLVCRTWAAAAALAHPHASILFANQLIELVRCGSVPHWIDIAGRRLVTRAVIERFPDWASLGVTKEGSPWTHVDILGNPNMTLSDLNEFCGWRLHNMTAYDRLILLRNPTLSWQDICDISRHRAQCWSISNHPAITPAIVDNESHAWNVSGLAHNPAMARYVLDNLDRESWQMDTNLMWKSFVITQCHKTLVAAAPLADIKDIPGIAAALQAHAEVDPRTIPFAQWSEYVFHNPNLTWSMVAEFEAADIEKRPAVNWHDLLRHPNIAWEDMVTVIERARQLGCCIESPLSLNPQLTCAFVQAHPEIAWSPSDLACNTFANARWLA